MPVGHELLIIALNGDSLAAGSTAHYPVTILNHRHKQLGPSMCTHAYAHTHTHNTHSCMGKSEVGSCVLQLSVSLFIAIVKAVSSIPG